MPGMLLPDGSALLTPDGEGALDAACCCSCCASLPDTLKINVDPDCGTGLPSDSFTIVRGARGFIDQWDLPIFPDFVCPVDRPYWNSDGGSYIARFVNLICDGDNGFCLQMLFDRMPIPGVGTSDPCFNPASQGCSGFTGTNADKGTPSCGEWNTCSPALGFTFGGFGWTDASGDPGVDLDNGTLYCGSCMQVGSPPLGVLNITITE